MEDLIYFWKPDKNNGYLGNWYDSPFIKDGINFKNNEQYFMWRKQQLFDPSNVSLATNILNECSPAKIKNFGRKVNNFDETIWEEQKMEIMKEGLVEKFLQNRDLLNQLFNTRNAILVEASPYDKIWGIGINEKDAKKNKEWQGLNLLGKALMEVRDILEERVQTRAESNT